MRLICGMVLIAALLAAQANAALKPVSSAASRAT